MTSSEQESDGLIPNLYLDCGTDSDRSCGAVHISERGMRFVSRWQFSIGTQLSVALHHMHPRLGLRRVVLEGTVVWSQPTASQRHESTLLFLELPDELKPSLREFSCLAASG